MKIKNNLLFLFLILCTSTAIAGTEIQNGGVGLKINGKVVTFYSAKLDILPTPLKKIDGLDKLILEIQNLTIGSDSKLKLLQSILPGTKRNYFQLQNALLQKASVQKIIEEYKQKTGLNEEMEVLGITNPQTSTTLLLPDFLQLTSIEKTAILFHESLWLSGHVESIEQMITIEYLFQQYLDLKDQQAEHQAVFDFYGQLCQMFQDPYTWQLLSMFNRENNGPSPVRIE